MEDAMSQNHFETEELLGYIMRQKHKIIFIDGPSNCGKTNMLKNLKACVYNTIMVSGENFYSTIIKNIEYENPFELDRETEFLVIEDLDYFGGRPRTEKFMAHILSLLSNDVVVVVSGINIQRKMESLMKHLHRYEYFVKVVHNGVWNKNIKGD